MDYTDQFQIVMHIAVNLIVVDNQFSMMLMSGMIHGIGQPAADGNGIHGIIFQYKSSSCNPKWYFFIIYIKSVRQTVLYEMVYFLYLFFIFPFEYQGKLGPRKAVHKSLVCRRTPQKICYFGQYSVGIFHSIQNIDTAELLNSHF